MSLRGGRDLCTRPRVSNDTSVTGHAALLGGRGVGTEGVRRGSSAWRQGPWPRARNSLVRIGVKRRRFACYHALCCSVLLLDDGPFSSLPSPRCDPPTHTRRKAVSEDRSDRRYWPGRAWSGRTGGLQPRGVRLVSVPVRASHTAPGPSGQAA